MAADLTRTVTHGNRVPGALVIVAALASGCSGGSDASRTTTPTTSATSAPAAITPTTLAATPPPTPSTVPTTTVPPATLPTDIDQVEQDVIAAALASWEAYRDAVRDPGNVTQLEALAATSSGATLTLRLEGLASIIERGLVAVENPTVPASIDIDEASVVVDTAAGTASVEFCRIGSDLGIEPGGNPDGTDRIVVNEVNAYHERAALVLVDGRWHDDSGELIAEFEGATTCE